MNFMDKLYRSRKDAVILGVCGGLGNYWRIDPLFIRVFLLFIGLVTFIFPLVIVYLLSALIIPKEPVGNPTPPFTRLYRSRQDAKIAGICGGLGRYLGIDSTWIRLAVVLIGILTAIAPMVATYIVGWIIIPVGDPDPNEIEIR